MDTKYTKCFLVYLDILGLKEKVKETKESPEMLKTLINALEINKPFTQAHGKKTTDDGKLDIRSFFFSDSFVFIMKAEKKNIPHLFLIVRYLQDRLWEKGLCLRGAIVKGEMYWPTKEENIILGPAMIEAYKLESEIAIYPRIVVSNKLFTYIENEHISAWPIGNRGILKEFIKKDKDGIYFFDILHPEVIRKVKEYIKQKEDNFGIYWGDSMENNYRNILKQVEEIVGKGINEPDEKIKQKYEWLKSYLEESKKTAQR